MTTTTKVSYTGQSKCVTASVSIESDTLSETQIQEQTIRLMLEAQDNAHTMTMDMDDQIKLTGKKPDLDSGAGYPRVF